MKLQKASVYEIKRMAKGSVLLGAAQTVVFLVLWLFKVVDRFYPTVIGTVGGIIITVLSFTILCLAIQRAADTQDQ